MEELTSVSDRVSQITGALLSKWQNIADMVAELLMVPAGLIMRCQGNEIEVLVASASAGNPYHPGKELLSGPASTARP
jgi:hypothetical protein